MNLLRATTRKPEMKVIVNGRLFQTRENTEDGRDRGLGVRKGEKRKLGGNQKWGSIGKSIEGSRSS